MNTLEALGDIEDPNNKNNNKFIKVIREFARINQVPLDTAKWIIKRKETKQNKRI